ncbi:MAG: hypothetical protein OEZ16_10740, partial [Chromatiales bacterium]|nr:hypothetical protein [Chromatiales bacterium]
LLLQNRLTACLASGEMQSQPLLIPATVRLDERAISLLEQHATTLLRLGVMVERLGEEAVVLRQLPLLLRGVVAEGFVTALAAFLAASPDIESDVAAYLRAFSTTVAPLLPTPDSKVGEALLRELEQLLSDGHISEAELPWRLLSASHLAALFTDE